VFFFPFCFIYCIVLSRPTGACVHVFTQRQTTAAATGRGCHAVVIWLLLLSRTQKRFLVFLFPQLDVVGAVAPQQWKKLYSIIITIIAVVIIIIIHTGPREKCDRLQGRVEAAAAAVIYCSRAPHDKSQRLRWRRRWQRGCVAHGMRYYTYTHI